MLNFERLDWLLSLFRDPEEKLWPYVFAMGFIFMLRASRSIMSFNRESESNIMAVRICMVIPFLLSRAMIYYGPQSDILVKSFARRNSPESSMIRVERRDRLLGLFGDPVEKLWPFVFAMGFIFILRASRSIMSFNQESESNIMVVRICMVSPIHLSRAMIYYGPQSDIQVKSFARRNSPESSMIRFVRRDRLLCLFVDPVEKLWSFVFAMGFIFFLSASHQIMSLDRASESNVMAVRICMGIPFQLLIAMIYYKPQSDRRVKFLARRNSPESSMFNFERLDRLLSLFGHPEEKLWSFVFAMGFIFILRASRSIMSFNQESESTIMAVRICMVSPFLLSRAIIYYGPQSDIQAKIFAHWNSPKSSMINFERRDRLLGLFGDPVEKLWSFVFAMGYIFFLRAS